MFDLGALFAPQNPEQPVQPQATAPTSEAQAPGLADQWSNFFQQPDVRAGLLSFGLQTMMGSYGGPGVAIAQGIGAGAETIGARQTAQQQLDKEALARSDKLTAQGQDNTEKALDRASREKIARMGIDSRESLFAQKNSGPGGMSKEEYKQFMTNVRAHAKTLSDANILKPADQQLSEDQILDQSIAMARETMGAAPGNSANSSGQNGGTAPVRNSVSGNAPGAGAANSTTQPKGAKPAPEGTVVVMQDGSRQKKVNGKWVPM